MELEHNEFVAAHLEQEKLLSVYDIDNVFFRIAQKK